MYAKLNAKQQATLSSSVWPSEVYHIVANLGPRSAAQVRCYNAGEPLFASLSREYPGDFARWEFQPVDGQEGVFKIKNVGLDGFVVTGTHGTLTVAFDDAEPAEFRVQPVGGGFVQVKEVKADKVWGLRGNVVRSDVVLQTADCSFAQKFIQAPN